VVVWTGRLLRLDFGVFEEIRAEPWATGSAVLIVFGASLCAGFGSWLWAVQSPDFPTLDRTQVFLRSFLVGSIIQTAVWFLWVYLVYQVLLRAYGVSADFVELVRTMGFAFAPVAFSLFIVFAGFAVPIGMLAFAMALLLTNVAIQTTTDAGAREATVANLAGFGAFLVVMGVFANIAEVGTFGGLAPGILFFSLDL
jgi:hypothetical protein